MTASLPRLSRFHWKLLAGLALGLMGLGVFWLWGPSSAPESEALASPRIALQGLAAKSLYYNGPALPWLRSQRPELLTAADLEVPSERGKSFAQAVNNPKLFRQLDRRYRFDAVLLVGDPSQYRPLLEHLLETPDWTLRYLDHTTLIYQRADSGPVWRPEALEALKEQFAAPRERALFLSRAAVKLLAIRRAAEAKKCLDEAQALNGSVPDLWNAMAIYRMVRGEWTPALTNVDRSLALDRDFLPAIATKTQILYSTKKFTAAFDLSSRLIQAYPDDPNLLFYHAKICHESHAYTAEIRALLRLIERAQAEDRPRSGYQIYLAQAYAGAGQAKPAVDQFEFALADPDLSKEQRKFCEDTMAQVKERGGLE